MTTRVMHTYGLIDSNLMPVLSHYYRFYDCVWSIRQERRDDYEIEHTHSTHRFFLFSFPKLPILVSQMNHVPPSPNQRRALI